MSNDQSSLSSAADGDTDAGTLEDVLEELAASERPKTGGSRWRWEKGDRIVLRISEVGEVDGKFGVRTYLKGSTEGAVSTEAGGEPLAEGTQRTLYCDAAVLRSFYEAEKPETGDVIAVLYQGKDEDGHDFRAKVVSRIPF
jgi:hypothetical protein